MKDGGCGAGESEIQPLNSGEQARIPLCQLRTQLISKASCSAARPVSGALDGAKLSARTAKTSASGTTPTSIQWPRQESDYTSHGVPAGPRNRGRRRGAPARTDARSSTPASRVGH
jgi:hypothetical protein